MRAEALPELLRATGLRVTAPRVMVLQALAAQPHSTAEAILTRSRAGHGALSTQGAYNVLAACCEAGIVRRIQPAGSPALYELRVGDNHHHLVCRRCGQVQDVECRTATAPCLGTADDLGYEIDEAEVLYWGICPDCQARPEISPPPATDRPPDPQRGDIDVRQ